MTAVVLFSLMAVAVPVLAHHSMSAEFDYNSRVTITGVITKVDWANPHVWIYLETQDAGKSSVAWGIESAPPGGLQGKGIAATSFPVGTRITVDGFPAVKPNTRKIAGASLTLPNGRQLDIRDTWSLRTLPR